MSIRHPQGHGRNEREAEAERDFAEGEARRAPHRMCGVSIISGELVR
jgi:hypothetical protein